MSTMTTNTRIQKRAAKLLQSIAEQRKWIEQCGGSRGGYILRYGAADDPNKSGDGGEAIWTADSNELKKLLTEYEMLTGRRA